MKTLFEQLLEEGDDPKDTEFYLKDNVNGVDIHARYDAHYEDYSIYLPQADSFVAVIRISTEKEKIMRAYDYARKLASEGMQANAIARELESNRNEL